jgi:hypothetical protein
MAGPGCTGLPCHAADSSRSEAKALNLRKDRLIDITLFIDITSQLDLPLEANDAHNAEAQPQDRIIGPHARGSDRDSMLTMLAARSSPQLRILNPRKGADLLSRAWRHHQEAVEDPAGRMRERYCMALRLGALCEELDLRSLFMPYSVIVGMLPRLRFLGQDAVDRVLALRRVNLAMGSASTCTRPSDTKSLLHPDMLLRTIQQQALANHGQLFNDGTELDWVQRRHQAQALEELIQAIQIPQSPCITALPSSFNDIARVLKIYNGYFAYVAPHPTCCDIIFFDPRQTSTGPRMMRLPSFTISQVKRLNLNMETAQADSRKILDEVNRKVVMVGPKPMGEAVETVLAELWRILVHPVLTQCNLKVCVY